VEFFEKLFAGVLFLRFKQRREYAAFYGKKGRGSREFQSRSKYRFTSSLWTLYQYLHYNVQQT